MVQAVQPMGVELLGELSEDRVRVWSARLQQLVLLASGTATEPLLDHARDLLGVRQLCWVAGGQVWSSGGLTTSEPVFDGVSWTLDGRELDVHDVEAFGRYQTDVPALVSKHGGEYIVRGGESEVLEGDWQPKRLVIFRFPDRQSIHNLLDDPTYADLKALRFRTATSNIVAVDGID